MTEELRLCFSCARVFESDSNAQCPECGQSSDDVLCRKIMNYARAAVRYGIDYREAYEEEFKKAGRIETHLALSNPEAVMCFIGVAAISGVIGGVSHDLEKKVIGKIAAQFKKDKDVTVESADGQWSGMRMKYIEDFCNGFEEVDPLIRDEILQEIIVWTWTNARMCKLEQESEFGEDLKNGRDDEYKVVQEAPNREDFARFWECLGLRLPVKKQTNPIRLRSG